MRKTKTTDSNSSVLHKILKAIFTIELIILFVGLPVRLYMLKCEIESKMELAIEMECYGNYLAAYDIYMEVYGIMGDWKDVYNMAEEAKEKYQNQQKPQVIKTGTLYRLYPGPVPRFKGDE